MENVVLFRTNDAKISVNVICDSETVWLTQDQMSLLFEKSKSTINEHIKNIYRENELSEMETMKKFGISEFQQKACNFYNLDVIISVGYRVKSQRGTQFRRWANKILREYLLKGYNVRQEIEILHQKIQKHDTVLLEHKEKIDFFVQTSLPPIQGLFYNGQIFDAYKFANDLIRSAQKRIILIDNYVDDTTLSMLAKREAAVSATIYTNHVSHQLEKDLEKYANQYPPIEIVRYAKSHDRFILIDNQVYFVGASFKDLGKKMFAFAKLEIPADEFMKHL